MAFEILARLGLNSTGFHSGMKRAESAGVAFSNTLKSRLAGAFSIAAVGAFTKSIINAADRLGDLSDQSQLTTDSIQELQAIAGKRGLEVETLIQFIEKLKEARREALAGKKDIEGVFSQVGIDLEELATARDPGELFKKFAKGFAEFDEESRNAIAQAIGGTRAGGKLSSTIAAVGAGEQGGEIKFGAEDISAASKYSDAFKSAGREVQAFFGKMISWADKAKEAALFMVKTPDEVFRELQGKIQNEAAAEKAKGKLFQPFIQQPKAEKEAEIAAAAEAATPSRFTQDLSALQRIGEQILGGGGNNIQRDQLMELREIKRGVKELNSGTTSFP